MYVILGWDVSNTGVYLMLGCTQYGGVPNTGLYLILGCLLLFRIALFDVTYDQELECVHSVVVTFVHLPVSVQ